MKTSAKLGTCAVKSFFGSRWKHSPRPPLLGLCPSPLPKGFAPGPHWRPSPQTLKSNSPAASYYSKLEVSRIDTG